MLICNDQVRLDARERRQLMALTGSCPDHIRTRTQLEAFVRAHLVHYPGRNASERLLRRMLESFLQG